VTGHTNPTLRLIAQELVRRSYNDIFRVQRFLWQITMVLEFDYDLRVQYEERQLIAWCNIDEINDACKEQLADARRHGNMDKYVTTRFTVECLSINPPPGEESC